VAIVCHPCFVYISMHPLERPLRFFFRHLYHGMAWTYDLVSGAVSFGRWNDWIREAAPYMRGRRILELGHGPGHLQAHLSLFQEWFVAGLDESAQMGRLAVRRVQRERGSKPRLVRALAQRLPCASAWFDTLVATFPTEYIFDPQTLGEARRVLRPGGRLVVLPVAWPRNALLALLFRLTGQSPAEAVAIASRRLAQPFRDAGFVTEVSEIGVQSGILLIVTATKPEVTDA
jgi:ubiquinone/menaquinone biosynthesis C-methylase UbiE